MITSPKTSRLLVLTDPSFYDFLKQELRGKVPAEVTLKLICLPPEIQEEVARIQVAASKEVSPLA